MSSKFPNPLSVPFSHYFKDRLWLSDVVPRHKINTNRHFIDVTDGFNFNITVICSIHLRLGLPSSLFPSSFPTIILYSLLFSPIRATCPADLILLDLIILIGEDSLARSTSYAAPHYALFYSLPSLHLSLVQIFS
jgi:hypothetical protein